MAAADAVVRGVGCALDWVCSQSLIVGLGLAALLLMVLARKQRAEARRDFDSIPGPWKNAHPLLGNMLDILKPDVHRVLLDWADKYGGIYRARVLWMEGLVVTEPTAVAAICGRGDGGLDKADIVYTPINQMCTPHGKAPNLLTSPADSRWRAVRKAVAVSFSANNIRKKFPVIQAYTDRLVKQLEGMAQDSKTGAALVDVDQAALRVTLDVIGMAAFGHEFGSTELGPPSVPAPPTHLLRVLPRCFTEIMIRVANPVRALMPSMARGGLKGQQSFMDFHAEMRMLLQKCLARPTPPDAEDVSIGAQLWRLYHESQGGRDGTRGCAAKEEAKDGDPTAGGLLPPLPGKLHMFALRLGDLLRSFSVGSIKGAPASTSNGKTTGDDALISAERIMSEIGILFVEGFETTGHTISWTLLKVATVPGVQERIAAELDEVGLLVKPTESGLQSSARGREREDLPSGPRPVGLDDLPRLKYLTASIKESMRMLPVVSIMGRSVGTKPTRVGPYVIPPGTPVAIPLFAIHNTIHNWEEPKKFLPERWLQVPVETYVVGSMFPLSETHEDEGKSTPYQASAATDTPGVHSKDGRRIIFAPFSEGPRNCVGQTLAKIEVITVLATLLAHFRVELAPEMGGAEGVRNRESTHLTLQLKGTQGLRMRLYPRSIEGAN